MRDLDLPNGCFMHASIAANDQLAGGVQQADLPQQDVERQQYAFELQN
jgi:hypothetical protein